MYNSLDSLLKQTIFNGRTRWQRKIGQSLPISAASSGKVGYFRGAFAELKQVHFPTRKSTWKMTLAVIIYVVVFLVFIALLDVLFELIFNNILGS